MISKYTISLNSSDEVPDFIDITEQVADLVEKSGVQEGQVLIFSQHTTAAVVIQEDDKAIFKDVKDTLDLVASKTREYQHNIDGNGYAHCQHIFIGPSEVVPVSEGKMMLGTYQHIYLVELDRARARQVIVQVSGE